jgi:hypothetical protein
MLWAAGEIRCCESALSRKLPLSLVYHGSLRVHIAFPHRDATRCHLSQPKRSIIDVLKSDLPRLVREQPLSRRTNIPNTQEWGIGCEAAAAEQRRVSAVSLETAPDCAVSTCKRAFFLGFLRLCGGLAPRLRRGES